MKGRGMEEEALEKLITILGHETSLLEQLHGQLAAQQQALVRGNVEEIKQTVEGQIATLSEIQKLERERMSLLDVLESGEETGQGITLSRLIEVAPQHGERLSQVRSALKEVLDAIGTLNRHNGMLINQSLSYIGKTLKMIAGEDKASTVYTPQGDVTCPTGRLAVDRKV
jgi:flagellar biosynthesis/type III secretory pathway chaperone